MILCPWCATKIPGRFATLCPECDAQIAHEADDGLVSTFLVRPGRPEMDKRLPAEPPKPDHAAQDRASFDRVTTERYDREQVNQMGGYW